MAEERSEPVPVGPEPVPVNPEPVPATPEPGEAAPEPVVVKGEDDLSVVDFGGAEEGESKVRAMGGRSPLDAGKREYKRDLNVTGQGATRCRVFHSRIAEAPLDHLEKTINEWIDDKGIEVKNVGHVIGVMMGKTREENFIVMVWY